MQTSKSLPCPATNAQASSQSQSLVPARAERSSTSALSILNEPLNATATAKPTLAAPASDIGALFPGSDLSHVLHVVTEPSVAAVSSVIACLETARPASLEVQSFHVRRLPTAFDQRICVQGINECQARDIRARLERLDPVARVRLEHQVRITRAQG